MTFAAPRAELHPEFSAPGASPTPWHDVVDVIATAELCWISTVRADERPHVTPLTTVWTDGEWQYESRDGVFHHDAGIAYVFAVRPTKVLSFAKGDFAQTRFRFDS